ncbi:unnamed protein product, partial [Meganyctiphanes norvegica]
DIMQRPRIAGWTTLLVLISGAWGNLPPSFLKDMNLEVLNEDTPVGAAVYTLQATDPEEGPIKYGLTGSDRLKVNPETGVVTVTRPLDREIMDTLRLVVTAEDEVPGAQSNNIVQLPISLIILDANDNAPEFLQTPYETIVAEDAEPGTTVLPGIKLMDKDQVGEVIKISCAPLDQDSEGCDVFEVVPSHTSSREFSGALVLRKRLSYAVKDIYRLTLEASDGVHESRVGVVVRVRDVQNSPPRFLGSLTGIVTEDDPIGTKVMTLKAEDGDQGAPRNVYYGIVSNPLDFFLIDPITGEIKTAKPLDREALKSPDGVVKVQVKAYEVIRGSAVGGLDTETVADVTITIRDVNDEAPKFNKREYRATIPENVPEGTPLPNLDMFVQDTDVGSNSVFTLRLVDASGLFTVEPAVASSSTSVALRLARGPLDYENPNQRKFLLQVIAEESLSPNRLSSTATVVVEVQDTNDNPPRFTQEAYTAVVSETATPGTLVTTIEATDRDTGIFGQDGIQYSLYGNGAEKFEVDTTSGVVTVAFCDTPGQGNCLDFETRPTYFLSFQATDANGSGHTTVVPIRLSLADSNDNTPKFERPEYTALIHEKALEFDPPLIVMAEDPDASSRITYSLVGGNNIDMFTIDEASGQVTISNSSLVDISYLQKDTIILTVQASDGESSHTANIQITIQDSNNNLPIFSKTSYIASVQEKSPPGSVVEQVAATDADTGINAKLTYRINRGGYDDYAIDASTGLVTLTRTLDYDKRDSYTIEIIASDGGIPRQSSTATLTVNVINNNDKNPYFTPTTQRTQVSEDAVPGTLFYQLAAQDPDVGEGGSLIYGVQEPITAVDPDGHIVQGDNLLTLQALIFIEPSTGQVSLVGVLDRSIATELSITVTVTDTSANPPQIGTGTLVVTIVDVNDFPPEFPPPWTPEEPFIKVRVSEEIAVGSHLYSLVASDPDSNIAGYALVDGPYNHFALDNSTGVVTVLDRLDYETQHQLSFTVMAWDTGIPTLSATATVLVELINVNDEEPVFSAGIYDAEVAENSPPGTPVITVTAVDRDEGSFGQVSYSLAGHHSNSFIIDASGSIVVKDNTILNREQLDEVVLRVVATDQAPENQRRQSSAPVHIKITDVNDNSPKFSQVQYSASIVENLPLSPPAPIVQVTAYDKDIGINANITYIILEGNEQELFKLDSETGIIYPAQILDASQPQHTLTIIARDMAGAEGGSESENAFVEIEVLPQNQHKPKFIRPALPNATITIKENGPPVQTVLEILAEDKDSSYNGEVRYHLRLGDDNVQDTDNFHMDPITGVITTKKTMDREFKHKYQLVLVAKDQGSPISYETLRFLTVVLEDENDNRPMFPKRDSMNMGQQYKFSVEENAPKNTRLGQVKAEDADEGINGKIFYYIVSGNEAESFFIDKLHANIYTSAVLDREYKSSYTLVIKATNDPNFIVYSPEDDGPSIVYDENDSTIALVNIVIEDVNDTPPKFVKDELYAGVSHEAGVGALVRMVEATDADAGENGTLSYSIRASNLYRLGETRTIGSIIPSPFNITKNGKLITASLMSQYRRQRFELEIQAKEEAPPHRVAICKVNVWVWQRADLVRLVLAQPPEEVVNNQEYIAATLSEVTSGTAVVDQIRYHVDSQNTVNREWTDMLVHVVNEQHQVKPITEVLTSLDHGYGILKNKTHTFHIENLNAAYMEVVEEEVDARLAGLISLVIVLFIGFISFIVVCCCLRYWVMSPAGKSQEHLIKRNIDDDLGLNTTENPLWVEQKLKMYEEQELTMQVMSEFDANAVNQSAMNLNVSNGGGQLQTSVLDGDWMPEHRGSIDMSHLDAASNTYATIQKSHGGTLRSLQLKALQSNGTLTLGEDPGESNDYATLDHLQQRGPTRHHLTGPRVPGVTTPRGPIPHQSFQELQGSFTGSTFQAPDSNGGLAQRPLPQEPNTSSSSSSSASTASTSTHPRAITYNSQGEPVLVAELI